MKFIVSLLLMALLSFSACLFLPWWSIAIVCFLVSALIRQSPLASFATGFAALFFLWSSLSLYISTNNDHLLASKISEIILNANNPNALILITGAIGALVGGFGALTGSLIRKAKPDSGKL